jgi:uncharacterized membrane protein/YHS domain-containing protein
VSGPSEIFLFFGRLHPVLVHLPIGLIVVLAVLEFVSLRPRFRHVNASAGVVLAVAVPMAIFTVVCGWLLSLGGGYQPGLLQWHKWTGIVTAAFCALAGLLYRFELRKAYRWFLVASVLVLVIASHFGGSLTHGSDYLVKYAPNPVRAWFGSRTETVAVILPSNPSLGAPVFASLVKPVLEQNCVSCHGPEKAKGKLRVDTFAALIQGAESGPVVLPGKSAESAMIKRMRLPLTDEDHMPPDGKPQPSRAEIALLEWWIDAGAPAEKRLGELKPPIKIARIAAARLDIPAASPKTVSPRPLEQVLPLAESLVTELKIVINPLSQTEPWLQCNAAIAGTNFTDTALARLSTVAPNLRWLDLGGTGVTDSGLAHVAGMLNLTRLHLERTTISDEGLSHLTDLAGLEYLNLYGTQVTDTGLVHLEAFPKLKQLYLWETKVSARAAQAFVEARTDKNQLQGWAEEIEQLKARIRDAQLAIDLGATPAPASDSNSTPINTECPVSGKPVDASKTVSYEGRPVAFCCDDCKAKFQQDPKPFLAKLNLIMPAAGQR